MDLRTVVLAAALVAGLSMAPLRAAGDCTAPAAVCAARDAVFPVAAYDPVGSAVRIDDELLVTSRHIVADHDHATVTLPDGSEIEAAVVPNAGRGGLALLRANGLGSGPFLTSSSAAIDGPVYVIGTDVGTRLVRALAPGTVLNRPADEHPRARLRHDAYSQPGTSGGALVDDTGNLIAIVASGGEGRHDAIPARAIDELVTRSGPQHRATHQLVGQAYRECSDLLDVYEGRRATLSDDIALALFESCRATGNRRLLTVAGRVLGESRRLDESIALFEEALALDPNAVNTRLSLVVSLHFAARFADELPHLGALMTDLPNDPQVLRFAIQAGKWSGRDEVAEAAYDALAEHHPRLAPPTRRFLDSDAPCTFDRDPRRTRLGCLDRADLPGATNRPLCREHLGGTRAPASGRSGCPVGSLRRRAPVQGSVGIAVARPKRQHTDDALQRIGRPRGRAVERRHDNSRRNKGARDHLQSFSAD